jgi:hypothetical protein
MIFLELLIPFMVSFGFIIFPPSGWHEAHLALKIVSPLFPAANAAVDIKLILTSAVAITIRFFIIVPFFDSFSADENTIFSP